MGAENPFTMGNYHSKPVMTDVILIYKKKMALQPRSMTHQAHTQFRRHPVSTIKEVHLMPTNIHTNHKKEETPMGAKNPFTMGNYHCKPLMTHVILIYKVKKNMALHPNYMTHQSYAKFLGHLVSTSKEGHLILTNIHANHKKEKNPMGGTSAKVSDPPRLCPIFGTSSVH